MNKILLLGIIFGVLVLVGVGIFLIIKQSVNTHSDYNNPKPTIQYDEPIGPLMKDGRFYSKRIAGDKSLE